MGRRVAPANNAREDSACAVRDLLCIATGVLDSQRRRYGLLASILVRRRDPGGAVREMSDSPKLNA